MKKTVIVVLITLIMAAMLTACANFDFDETGQYVVTPKEALEMMDDGAVLVDAESTESYAEKHIDGAINIPMGALVVNEPYKNMLAEADQIAQVMSAAGVSEDDTLLVYDCTNNMKSARVQWTLNMYSNFNVKVVSGGLEALKAAGAEETADALMLDAAEYTAGDKQKSLIVNLDYVKAQINNPNDSTVIVDTRSFEEYAAGTIPGSVHIEYLWNNYSTGEYKSARDLQLVYLNKDIMPDTKIILYCKTSVRAAQSYSALKDAGYKDVRIYDGAWIEYEAVENPEPPSTTAPVKPSDAS